MPNDGAHGRPAPLIEVASAFLILGLTSFGGPIAHLGYMRREFVARRAWLGDHDFAELVALCQLLPGPASSQLAFALGMRAAGLSGALTASLLFLLPSAVLMIAAAYGLAALSSRATADPYLHGLRLAAVAVVTQAVWSMARSSCADPRRAAIAAIALGASLCFAGSWTQVGVIASGALAGLVLLRAHPPRGEPAPPATARAHRRALGAIGLFALLLLLGPLVARLTGSPRAALLDSVYRSGALVFGGGHVVLPLLRTELVPRGWITDTDFLAGYAAAQAVPGPLFSFAGFVGTVIWGPPGAWLGGLACLLAIFLPGWLVIAGALPFWATLRSRPAAQGALRGAAAAAVGILAAALYSPVITESVRTARDAALAIGLFVLLQLARAPAWAIVLLAAATGRLLA